jgi:hypothetical protein
MAENKTPANRRQESPAQTSIWFPSCFSTTVKPVFGSNDSTRRPLIWVVDGPAGTSDGKRRMPTLPENSRSCVPSDYVVTRSAVPRDGKVNDSSVSRFV